MANEHPQAGERPHFPAESTHHPVQGYAHAHPALEEEKDKPAPGGGVCQNCQRRGVTTKSFIWCLDCNMGYCEACLQQHDSLVTLRDHKMTTFSLPGPPERKVTGHSCPLHNLPKEFYCRLCSTSTCRLCARVQHRTCVLHKEMGLGENLPDEVTSEKDTASLLGLTKLPDTLSPVPRPPPPFDNDEEEFIPEGRRLSTPSQKGRRLSWAGPGDFTTEIPEVDPNAIIGHGLSDLRRASHGILHKELVDRLQETPLRPSRSQGETTTLSPDKRSDFDYYPKEKSLQAIPAVQAEPSPLRSILIYPTEGSDFDRGTKGLMQRPPTATPRLSVHRDSLEVIRISRRNSMAEGLSLADKGMKQSEDPLLTSYRHDERMLAARRAQLVRAFEGIDATGTPFKDTVPCVLRGSLDAEGIFHAYLEHQIGENRSETSSPDITRRSSRHVCQEVFRFLDPLIWEEPPKTLIRPKSRRSSFMNKMWLSSVVVPDHPPARCGLVPTLAINLDAIDPAWSGDAYQSMLVDIVVLHDGRLLAVADWNNSCIKTLERVHKDKPWVVKGLKMPGQPVSISAITSKLIATSLPAQHKVVLVTISPTLAVVRAIRTVRSYWGVAALDDEKLAVSYYGDPGGIDFLDLHGNRVEVFPPSQHDELWFITNPRYLCVAPNGDLILTDWRQHKVVCISLEGKVRWSWSDVQMRGPWGVCCVPEKQTLVSPTGVWKSILGGKLNKSRANSRDPSKSIPGSGGAVKLKSQPLLLKLTRAESKGDSGGDGEERSRVASWAGTPSGGNPEEPASRVRRHSAGWSKEGNWGVCVTDWGDNLWLISKDGLSTRGIMGRKDPDLLQLRGEDWPKAPRGLCATTNRHLYVTQGFGNKRILVFVLR